jgi:hypothetical protein
VIQKSLEICLAIGRRRTAPVRCAERVVRILRRKICFFLTVSLTHPLFYQFNPSLSLPYLDPRPLTTEQSQIRIQANPRPPSPVFAHRRIKRIIAQSIDTSSIRASSLNTSTFFNTTTHAASFFKSIYRNVAPPPSFAATYIWNFHWTSS